MNPYTVIIPSCTWGNVNQCLLSLGDVNATIIANGQFALELGTTFMFPPTVERACSTYMGQTILPWNFDFNFAACLNRAAAVEDFDTDFLFLNDDTRLLTPNGFNLLREAAYAHPKCGLMFPAVTGCTGNPEQIAQGGKNVRIAQRLTVPFIGVYIRRAIWDEIGPLDEDFCEDYGWEDSAYCTKVRAAGYQLGIFDGCVIEHGVLPSSYRPRGHAVPMNGNRAIFERKYGELAASLGLG